jgi:hypothetical protein
MIPAVDSLDFRQEAFVFGEQTPENDSSMEAVIQ